MDTTQLLNAIAHHRGAARGIGAEALARSLAVSPRRLRKLISEARDQGHAICGTPSTGYYMPITPAELNSACAFLEHRALKSLHLLARMRQIALPQLLGQLKLNQA